MCWSPSLLAICRGLLQWEYASLSPGSSTGLRERPHTPPAGSQLPQQLSEACTAAWAALMDCDKQPLSVLSSLLEALLPKELLAWQRPDDPR